MNSAAIERDRIYGGPPFLDDTQLDAIFEDFEVAAVKTGMLASQAVVESVVAKLGARGVPNLVVDPVMAATSGTRMSRVGVAIFAARPSASGAMSCVSTSIGRPRS